LMELPRWFERIWSDSLKALLRQLLGDSSSEFEEQTRTSVDYINPHRHFGFGGRNTPGAWYFFFSYGLPPGVVPLGAWNMTRNMKSMGPQCTEVAQVISTTPSESIHFGMCRV
jgi:hypothetical protein